MSDEEGNINERMIPICEMKAGFFFAFAHVVFFLGVNEALE